MTYLGMEPVSMRTREARGTFFFRKSFRHSVQTEIIGVFTVISIAKGCTEDVSEERDMCQPKGKGEGNKMNNPPCTVLILSPGGSICQERKEENT